MLSECARATSAEEARFRVDYPNSAPRRIEIIALDKLAEGVVRRLAGGEWNSATFMTAVKDGASADTDWLSDLAGQALSLLDQMSAADHVVTVSTAGESAEGTAIIADVCNAHEDRRKRDAGRADEECWQSGPHGPRWYSERYFKSFQRFIAPS